MTPQCKLIIAWLIAIFIAPIIIATMLATIRQLMFPPKYYGGKDICNPLVVVIGTTERAATLLLIMFVPQILLPFVGLWVGLKYAANWQQGEAFAREKTLLGLVGTTWSFGIAMAVGFWACPGAMNHVAVWREHGP